MSPIEVLAKAREKLCRLVLERDIEQEILFDTRSKDEARRMMKQLAKDGLAEKVDGKWRLTWSGQKCIKEAEARLRARR
jgi:hypothetical protein